MQTKTTAKLRKARRQIAKGDVRVSGVDQDGWRHFPERTLIRLDTLIEMQTELEALIADVQGETTPTADVIVRGIGG